MLFTYCFARRIGGEEGVATVGRERNWRGGNVMYEKEDLRDKFTLLDNHGL